MTAPTSREEALRGAVDTALIDLLTLPVAGGEHVRGERARQELARATHLLDQEPHLDVPNAAVIAVRTAADHLSQDNKNEARTELIIARGQLARPGSRLGAAREMPPAEQQSYAEVENSGQGSDP
ncbi:MULTISPECIES: hypothetical protein [Saccharopolyspora]|uniref:hypothetical protein n=1 Tax=Saccharopolyspora TaxID=1835 RepID=UPI00104CFB2E|nr:hypothetical protein [Saccharopolyspora elongata]